MYEQVGELIVLTVHQGKDHEKRKATSRSPTHEEPISKSLKRAACDLPSMSRPVANHRATSSLACRPSFNGAFSVSTEPQA